MHRLSLIALFCLSLPALVMNAAQAQLTLPPLQIPDPARTIPPIPDLNRQPLILLEKTLADMRLDRIADFVRANRDRVERDRDGQPALRGILIASGVDAAMVARAVDAGFAVLSRERIAGLDLELTRFRVPDGRSLARAEMQLAKLLPDAVVDVDNLYFTSGIGNGAPGILPVAALIGTVSGHAPLGLIDGGIAAHPSFAGRVAQQGFAEGAPVASRHGTAVASLLVGSGTVEGAAPGASLAAADVYGRDPAGGNASAIARALGWLAQRSVAVTTISLVGPDNKLLAAAIARAQQRGMLIVAAVGNDGPAAPAAYPASYHGVIAVTGVDRQNRILPEAGRGSHVDFAAPGDRLVAATSDDDTDRVRGTSFAAPLVAGRLVRHYPTPAIDRIETAVRALIAEARDLGKKGRDKIYGHGLICGGCGDD